MEERRDIKDVIIERKENCTKNSERLEGKEKMKG